MKALRTVIVVAILAYVAWIAIPGVQTFASRYMAPAGAGPPPPPQDAAAELAPAVEAAPQAEATATAVAEGSALEGALPDLKWIVLGGLAIVGIAILALAGRGGGEKARYA